MANALRVDVCQCAEQLVCVEFDLKDRHGCLHLVEVSRGTVDSLWNEFLDKVEIDFIFLVHISDSTSIKSIWENVRARHWSSRRP